VTFATAVSSASPLQIAMRDFSANAIASGSLPPVKKVEYKADAGVSPTGMQRGMTAIVVAVALSVSLADTALASDRSETGVALSPVRLGARVTQRTAALHNEVVSYLNLREGWDGEGSVTPSLAVVHNALAFLAMLPENVSLPESTVSADGEVGFYWKSPNVYIDVGFPAPGRISYYASAHGLIAREATNFDGSTISQELLNVISRA